MPNLRSAPVRICNIVEGFSSHAALPTKSVLRRRSSGLARVSSEGMSGARVTYLFLTALVSVVSMLAALTFAILTLLGVGR